MAAVLSALSWFVPIFAFLLVFIVVYAMLAKTGILGGSQAVMLFISFILACFFIIQASLVEFIQFSSAWFSVLIIILFFALVVIAFLPGKEPLAFLTKGSWFAWVLLGVIVAFFIISSAYVFNWVINWELVGIWFSTDVAGIIVLVIIAAVVSWKITAK